jgi:3-oxoacyl-[acyl-carrier protein] reductase
MNTRLPEARVFAPEDLRQGLTSRFEHEITEETVLAFARLSGDANPLHVDSAYAARTNYGARIVHGAYQVGLASALIGMHLPGRHVLLGGVTARFPAPLYYPTRVIVSGELTSWNAQSRAGSVRVTIMEAASQAPTADVQMHVTWHDHPVGRVPLTNDVGRVPLSEAPGGPAGEPAVRSRPLVLVTGASGGIGADIVARLAEGYTVIAMTRRSPAGDGRTANVIPVTADLQRAGWRDAVREAAGEQRIYAVVHAAWPGHPHGSLLQVDPGVIQQQLEFAALATTELARFLFEQEPDDSERGGRLIVLGSVAGTEKPSLAQASYSLGKAALEHTVRLLAPELARRRITVNVVSPSFVPVGMNRHATDRQQMKAAALVPLGRLCGPEDVVETVRFLLTPEASFISGQVIGLTGGQL